MAASGTNEPQLEDKPQSGIGIQMVDGTNSAAAAVDSSKAAIDSSAQQAMRGSAMMKSSGVNFKGVNSFQGASSKTSNKLGHGAGACKIITSLVGHMTATVAGPWWMWGLYLLVILAALGTFGWNFYVLWNDLFSRKITEVSTTYQESIPYPDIYWCLPSFAAEATVIYPQATNTGLFRLSAAWETRGIPGATTQSAGPACQGGLPVTSKLGDNGAPASACATQPLGVSCAFNGTSRPGCTALTDMSGIPITWQETANQYMGEAGPNITRGNWTENANAR